MAVLVVGAVVLVVVSVASMAALRVMLTDQLAAENQGRVDELVALVDRGQDPVGEVAHDDDLVLQVLDPAGRVVTASRSMTGLPPLAYVAPGAWTTDSAPPGEAYLVVAKPSADGRIVVLGESLSAVSETTSTVVHLLLVVLPLLLLAVVLATWWVVGRALAPVDDLRAEVDAIPAGDLERRVTPPAVDDEIGRLAATMNALLERVARSRRREQRLVADASHELRSPLAAIREASEVAVTYPETTDTVQLAESVHAEVLRLQALVDDLLVLARSDEQGLSQVRLPVDLDDLVWSQVVRLREEVSPHLDTTGVSPVQLVGDPQGLRRVVANLLDNAARHTRTIVRVAVRPEGHDAVLIVEDDGCGIPLTDRGRVFERFVRLDASRSRKGGGSGLGLAIVAEAVAAHRGEVALDQSDLGGLLVTVTVPLLPPA